VSVLDQILAQKEAYGDLGHSCEIGDAYIDFVHLIDTYTRSKVHAAPTLNLNPTARDDRTQNPRDRVIHQAIKKDVRNWAASLWIRPLTVFSVDLRPSLYLTLQLDKTIIARRYGRPPSLLSAAAVVGLLQVEGKVIISTTKGTPE
jgi:hypothetical protein